MLAADTAEERKAIYEREVKERQYMFDMYQRMGGESAKRRRREEEWYRSLPWIRRIFTRPYQMPDELNDDE